MCKIIIICYGTSQIMRAVHLKLTTYKKDRMDIIVTDEFSNYVNIANRLKQIKLFERVYMAETHEYNFEIGEYGGNSLDRLKNIMRHKNIYRKMFNIREKYDVFLCSDTLQSSELLYSELIDINPYMYTVYYEDGPFQVLFEDTGVTKKFSIRLKEIIKKIVYESFYYIFSFSRLHEKFDYGYSTCTNTEHRRFRNFKLIQYEKCEKLKEYVQYCNMIWNVPELDLNGKIVLLCQKYDAFGVEIPDEDIADDIIQTVGVDNVYIKMHPRDKGKKFVNLGAGLIEDNSVPWELFVLNNIEKEYVLVSFASNSTTNPMFYWGISVPVVSLLLCKEYIEHFPNNNYMKSYIHYCKENKLVQFPRNKKEFINIYY